MATDANLSTIGDFYLGSDISKTLVINGGDQSVYGVKQFNDGIEIGENNESIGNMCLAVGNNLQVGQYNFFYKGITFNKDDNYALIYLCEKQPRFPLPMARQNDWPENRIKLNGISCDCDSLDETRGLMKLFDKKQVKDILCCSVETAMRDDYNQLCIWYGENYLSNINNLSAGFLSSYTDAFTPELDFDKYNLEQTIGTQITIVNGDKISGLRCAIIRGVVYGSVLSVEFYKKLEEDFQSRGIIPTDQDTRDQKTYLIQTGIKFSDFEYDDASLVFIDQPELSGPANTSTYSSLNVGEFNEVTRRCSLTAGKENRTESDFCVALGRKAHSNDYCSFVWAPATYTTSPRSYTFTVGVREPISSAILPENTGRTIYIGDSENNYMELHKFIVACISSDENLLCALFTGLQKAQERKTIVTYMDERDVSVFLVSGSLTDIIEDKDKVSDVKIGNTVNKIGNNVFNGCINLSSVYVPETVAQVYTSSFYQCSSLTGISMPGLSSFSGTYAFQDCHNLKEAHIPNVVTIGTGEFYNCSSLTGISMPLLTAFTGNTTFRNCRSLKEAYIPSVVSMNVTNVFLNCSSLTSVTMPNVKTIGNNSFQFCKNLSSADVPNLESLGFAAFFETALSSIDIPHVTELRGQTFVRCRNLSGVNIENATKISDKDFLQCTNLAEIQLPKTKSIGLQSFNGCTKLSNVYMPNVEKIGEQAFNNCSRLSNVTIPASVNDGADGDGISANAFLGCTKLTSLTFVGKTMDEVGSMHNYPWGVNESYINVVES